MLPQGDISRMSFLQLRCDLLCLLHVIFMLFRISARMWIDLFQIRNRKWCLFRIFSRKISIKIRKFRLTMTYFVDDQTDLQSPVTQVHISDHLISHEAADTFYTLSNDCRAQMSYVKWLCDIGSTIINDYRALFFRRRNTKFFLCHHGFSKIHKQFSAYGYVDKSRFYHLYFFKNIVLFYCFYYFFRNLKRRHFVLFCCRHRTITLILAKIRAVRNGYKSKFLIIAGLLKSAFHHFL